MFDWVRRLFARLNPQTRGEFLGAMDAVNDAEGGGPGAPQSAEVGALAIPSGKLILRDPQWGLHFVADWGRPVEVRISLNLFVRPKGTARVDELILRSSDETNPPVERRELGHIGIDSAKVVVVDEEAHRTHWTETGPDRVGFIRVMKSDRCLKLLQRKFRFKIDDGDWHAVRIAGPVSVERENEVTAYLKTIPEFSDYPFLHFWVRTNNSFDRVNNYEKTWGFIPVGNSPVPMMLVCGTGYGDGCYPVKGGFTGDRLVEVRIPFVDGEEGQSSD